MAQTSDISTDPPGTAPEVVRDDQLIRTLRTNYIDEMDAATLYAELSKIQHDVQTRDLFDEMHTQEIDHANFWKERLVAHREAIPTYHRSLKNRIAPVLVRILGLRVFLSSLELNEQKGIIEYLDQSQTLGDERARAIAREILPAEKHHLTLLAKLARGEAAAAGESVNTRVQRIGDIVRDVIFGLNDGLLSNLSLIAGVSGASAPRGVVLLAGVAGLIAGMFSMAVGQYLSTKSQQEVLERSHQMALEEIRAVPEYKRAELRSTYLDQGIPVEVVDTVVDRVTASETLWVKALGSVGAGTDEGAALSPLTGGTVTGIGFALGAIVPLIPFLVTSGLPALITAAVLSGCALFVVGALKSLFTARNALRSGLEMLAIGAVAAAVTNGIGRLFGVAGIS